MNIKGAQFLLFCFLMFAVQSCRTSKVVSDDFQSSSLTTIVTTSDSVVQSSVVKDSIRVNKKTTDSIKTETNIVDSVIIETIITNTVDTAGNIIRTDRVTNRDHSRYNNTSKESAHVENVDSIRQSQAATIFELQRLNEMMVIKLDSINHSKEIVTEQKKSWWSNIKSFFEWLAFFIVAMILSATVLFASKIKDKLKR